MTTKQISTYVPAIDDTKVPWEIAHHIRLIYQKLNETAQGVVTLANKSSVSVSEVSKNVISSTNVISVPSSGFGGVNDQSGVTSYTTVSTDNGKLVILSNTLPISVSLAPQDVPWACMLVNIGQSTVTVTPANGTISYAGYSGALSMNIPSGSFATVAYDGVDWWAQLGGGGTITGVIAGTGLSGGGYSGNVTLSLSVPVSVADGGTGTSTPALVSGTGISVTGSWPDQTISVNSTVEMVAYHKVTSSTYTATSSNRFIGVNYAGSVSITLPDATAVTAGFSLVIKDESGLAVTNNITISPFGGQTIEGLASATINSSYDLRRLYSNGSNWFIW